MYMLIRMPLACLLVVSYTYFYYHSKKRLRTETSRVFGLLVWSAIVHLVAAAVTEYTVNNRDLVPEWFNYAWHIVFLISIICFCGFIYFYLILYIERGTGRKQMKSKAALLTVCLLGIVADLVLPIEYRDTVHGSYSLGMKAYALYVVVVYVMLMMLLALLRYRDVVGREKSNVLLCSVGIFVLVAMIQIGFPYMLLTGLAMTLIVLGLMVNTEDVHLYISYQTGLYNELGCREILQELLFMDQPFQVAVYVFLGADECIEAAMLEVQEELPEKTTRVICGTIADNALVVIPMTRMAGGAILPRKMPVPETAKQTLKYRREILDIEPDTSVNTVIEKVRDVKNRFESDELQKDELTGLLRRTAFVEKVNHMIKTGREFCFLMLDLDDFKSINDRYGHSVGDQALIGVADALRKALRETDVLCRMGGDEFAIALSDVKDAGMVKEIAGRIQAILDRIELFPEGEGKITVSIGVKICGQEDRPASFQEIYAQADAALYRAKYRGKNRVAYSDDRGTL